MRRHAIRLLAPLLLLAGCGGSNPVALGPGSASVQGRVYSPSGSLIPNISVSIGCGVGGPALVTATDSAGVYATNLAASDSLMTATRGKIRCEFSASQPSGAQVDSAIVLPFGEDGSSQSLKLIDLHLH